MSNATWIYSGVILCAIMAYGCSGVVIPIKGTYIDSPVIFTSTQSVDSIWSSLTKLFIANGLPVKKIDRTKGMIRTKKIPMNSTFSFEDNDGQLRERRAWVVLNKAMKNNKEWKPKHIYGEWSIQVSETGKGKTTIEVDPLVMCTYYPNMFTSMQTPGQSTGKLEEILGRLLNNK